MSQQVKIIVDTIRPNTVSGIEAKLASYSVLGFKLFDVKYIRMEKGGHDVMYTLVKDDDTLVQPYGVASLPERKRGRPAATMPVEPNA